MIREDSSADRAAVRTQMAKMQQDTGSNPVPPTIFSLLKIKVDESNSAKINHASQLAWRKRKDNTVPYRWHCYTYLWS